jgi:hypothetical protein
MEFRAVVALLPNHGVPKVDAVTGLVREYPDELAITTSSTSSGGNVTMKITEDADLGHRHFSLLHWLYPSSFLPHSDASNASIASRRQLQVAALATLHSKHAHGGGHTAWSAAWEATLYARLIQVDDAVSTLKRLMDRYLVSNLLSLHPPLQPKQQYQGTCVTCYQERHVAAVQKMEYDRSTGLLRSIRSQDKDMATLLSYRKRGFVTDDNSVVSHATTVTNHHHHG